jgi:uracil phosphoribosyltransferase
MGQKRTGVADVELLDNVTVLDHPLVRHKLSILRDERTGAKEFRELVRELAMLMAYEATRDFDVVSTTVRTPIMETETEVLAGKKVAVVPVLRAGLGMVDGILELLPAAKVGHLGMYRDEETLEPIEYYANLPADIDERDVLVVDPMLATGGSAVAACEALVARGAVDLKLLVLIAAPEGIGAVVDRIGDVQIVACAVDSHLDEHGFIVPGLGDAGDRLYGTL